MKWFLLFLGLAQASLQFKSKTSGVDPGRIFWPKFDWVAFPIVFSLNHAGESVTMVISFTVSTDLSDGLVEIHFPSDFTLSASVYYLSDTVLSVPIRELSNSTTTTIELENIVLPLSAGSYGPFGIYTRQSTTGQIVDVSQNFCNVGIETSYLPPPSDSLTIAFSDTNMDSVSARSSLLFTFELTKNLWVYDNFIVSVPSYFDLLNPVCISEDAEENLNYLNTTGNDLHTFGCYYSSTKKELYIYGLSVDIDINSLSDTGSLFVSFLVTGFSNPIADYDVSLYPWTLTIYRFGTATIIQSFTGIGPETSPGIISVNSWEPHSNYDSDKIVAGLTLFMDLTFTADHQIPASGSFAIKFTGVDLTSKSWKSDKDQGLTGGTSGYYFVETYIGGTCTVSLTSIVCSGFDADIVARNSISISLLVTFTSSSAYVSEITTYLDSSTEIDSLATPVEIIYASSVVVASSYTLLFSSSLDTSTGNRVCNTGGGLYYLTLYLHLPTVAIAATDDITLVFPISTTISEDFTINTGNILSGSYLQQSSLQTDLTTGTSISAVSITTESLVFNAATSSTNYLSAVFYIDDGSGGPDQLNLPYIASNLWTRYESRVEITISSILYIFSAPFTILPDSPSVTFDLLCTDSGKAGLPGRISGSMNFDYSSIYSLYIDITFTGSIAVDLGSGLDSGEKYPFDIDSTSSIPASAVMIITVGTSPILTISGLSSILQTSLITAYFPIGALSASSYTVVVSLYYVRKDRNDVHFQAFSTSSTRTAVANTANWQTATTTVSTTSVFTPITSSSAGGLDLTLRSASTALNTLGYFGVILPKGFTVKDGSISDSTNLLSSPLTFTSENIRFAFPGILASETASVSLSTSSSKTLHVFGVTTTSFYNSVSPSVSITPYEAGVWNSACQSITGTLPSFSITRGLLSPSFEPLSVFGRGPKSLQVDMVVTVSVITAIPSGGYIEFALSGEWTITVNTEFYVTGLSPAVFSTSAPYIISGFDSVPAGTVLVINITNLLPPLNSGSTTAYRGHLDYISTYAGTSTELIDSWIDITDSITPDSSVEVIVPYSTGTPTFLSAASFPNTASTKETSVMISFTLENNLPSSSFIQVKSPTSTWAVSGSIEDKCWFTLKYSSCTVSGNQITVTLLEEYTGGILNLLIDGALDSPTSLTDTYAFDLSSTFSSVLVDKGGDITENQVLTIISPPSSVINPGTSPLLVIPNNAGELASYTFNFTISVATVVGDEIWIKFPNVFDPYIGEARVLFTWGEPLNYYIDCESTILGSISCYADHWFIIVTSMNTLAAGKNIDITLKQIRNPPVTSSMSSLQIYLLSSASVIKAMKTDYSGTEITAVPDSNIQIRNISSTSHYFQKTSDYTFSVYFDLITFAEGDSIIISFPSQFMLDRELASDIITCTSTYIDEIVSLVNEVVWDSGLSCTYLGDNFVSLNISVLGSWTDSDLISLTLKNIPNPEWGLGRSGYFDADDSVYFSSYSEFSNSFEVFAYANSSGSYMGRSYGMMNAAFVGYNNAGMVFSIAGFKPQDTDVRTCVVPGAQTGDLDITITERLGLIAKKVVFTPKNHVKNSVVLEFSSSLDNFFITQGQNSISFRVSTSTASENSLAYIEWTADEYSLIGLTSDAYETPPKTLIEVYALQKYSLTSEAGIKFEIGTTSIPIRVSAERSPNTNFTLSLSFADPTLNGVEISPIFLVFSNEFTESYFEIIASDAYTGTFDKSYSIQFDISGDASFIYTLPTCTFSVTSVPSTITSDLVFSLEEITNTRMDVYVTSKITSQVYWQLAAKGTELYDYSEITNITKPLVSPNSNLSLKDQLIKYHLNLEYEPLDGETWANFQTRLYKSALSTVWYDVSYVVAGAKTLLFTADWLWGETEYFLQVYTDGETTPYNTTATTTDLPSAVLLELLFNDLVVESKAYPLTTIVAFSLGVPGSELYTQSVTTGRRLADSTTSFSWILTTNRASDISPSELYGQVDQTALESAVFESGIANTIISFTSKTLAASKFQTPYWTNSGYPSLDSFTNSTIDVLLKSAVTGTMCCVAETGFDESKEINPTQVFMLLGRNNLPASGICVSNSAVSFADMVISISGLADETNYTVTCAAYNIYPLWPISVPYTENSYPLPSFTVVTEKTAEFNMSTSSGWMLVLPFLAYLV